MLVEWLVITIVVFILSVAVYGIRWGERRGTRMEALVALTSFAWPLWLCYAVCRLFKALWISAGINDFIKEKTHG